MPKIFTKETDRLAYRESRRLLGECRSAGVNNATIADWLGCTSQNVGQHFRKGTFSLGQALVIRAGLEKIRKENDL